MRKQFEKCHLTQWRSELATEVVRFDTVRLLSLGLCENSRLCQQTTNNSWAEGGDSTRHWRNGGRNYAEMSRISSKEQECASRVMGEICRILRSTNNHSVCTLYLNKNICTFWINGVFYYKIKSCALVGTSYAWKIFLPWSQYWDFSSSGKPTILPVWKTSILLDGVKWREKRGVQEAGQEHLHPHARYHHV
jgi:hypothetical protein